MPDDQARNALRDAISTAIFETIFQEDQTIKEASDRVLAILPDHALALLAMLGSVREGAFNHKGKDESDSTYWQVVDLPYAQRWGIVNYVPVFVVTLRPAGEEATSA